ncbi:unnamed protein product [Closterium sp. NIES-54]
MQREGEAASFAMAGMDRARNWKEAMEAKMRMLGVQLDEAMRETAATKQDLASVKEELAGVKGELSAVKGELAKLKDKMMEKWDTVQRRGGLELRGGVRKGEDERRAKSASEREESRRGESPSQQGRGIVSLEGLADDARVGVES